MRRRRRRSSGSNLKNRGLKKKMSCIAQIVVQLFLVCHLWSLLADEWLSGQHWAQTLLTETRVILTTTTDVCCVQRRSYTGKGLDRWKEGERDFEQQRISTGQVTRTKGELIASVCCCCYSLVQSNQSDAGVAVAAVAAVVVVQADQSLCKSKSETTTVGSSSHSAATY